MTPKLPSASILKSHLQSGMDRIQIAERYGVHRDTVSIALVRHKLEHLAPAKAEGPARRITRHPVRESVAIENGKIVIIREMVAGENGGVTLRSMSLPLISMHVASLQERGL